MNAHAEIRGLLDQLRDLPVSAHARRVIETCTDDIETISEAFGYETPENPWEQYGIRGQCAVIADMLAARMGQWVKRQALFQRLYGGRPECDQPEDVKNIDVRLCLLRKCLAGSPYDIPRGVRGDPGVMMIRRDQSALAALGSLAA